MDGSLWLLMYTPLCKFCALSIHSFLYQHIFIEIYCGLGGYYRVQEMQNIAICDMRLEDSDVQSRFWEKIKALAPPGQGGRICSSAWSWALLAY